MIALLAGTKPVNGNKMLLPLPDRDAAVQSEYDRVLQTRTREDYERFIRRHPDRPFADKTREKLNRWGLD
ncbi:MAG TPA: hypothetical protein VL202_04150 [Pararhizobium sp.]|uniref:hypothetical protein n=1 Tax=Pararhizobium sp. TaxID=1977563 RepID=UPI002BC45387|nr:hypothetical protein [Pararhizobium sp.]HTO30362.1 hypothetical protein [Pararhizobium sp.]